MVCNPAAYLSVGGDAVVGRPQPVPDPDPGLHLVDGPRYASWESVYRDNVERVYRLMFARVGNRPDAEDLTTEVFLAALPRLRGAASIGEVRGEIRSSSATTASTSLRRSSINCRAASTRSNSGLDSSRAVARKFAAISRVCSASASLPQRPARLAS